jgi:small subunit ribosomal protein S18
MYNMKSNMNSRNQNSRTNTRNPRNVKDTDKQKKRVCKFCESKDDYINYLDEKRLIRFVTEQGKIIPKRISGTCAKHQRMLTTAIKRARHLALIPFVSDAVK